MRENGKTRACGGIATLLSLALLGSCDTSEGPPEAGRSRETESVVSEAGKPEFTDELRARGQTLFARQCAACHGETGRGDGPAAYLLYPKPRDFSRAQFRLVSTDNGPTDLDLFRTISRGMPGSAMPSWEHLPEMDRWALVAEVRHLARDGYAEDVVREAGFTRAEAEEMAQDILTPGEPIELPSEPASTLESIARGQLLYLQNCAPCHDADGRGRLRQDLKDTRGFPIYSRDFTRGVFKGSADGDAIALRVLAGLPGSPMPSYGTTFASAPEDFWAIVHYVESLVPARAQERVAQKRRTIRVKRVAGPLGVDLADEEWKDAPSTYVALMPLWWRLDLTEGVLVRALHDGARLALRLTWTDPSEDRLSLRTEAFSDAAAVQLSGEVDPPFFAMGSAESQVVIWYWKALYQEDLKGHRDVEHAYPRTVVDHHPAQLEPSAGENVALDRVPASSLKRQFLPAAATGNPVAMIVRHVPVEQLAAKGFGSLSAAGPDVEDVDGASSWDGGVWDVVLVRDLDRPEDEIALAPGRTLRIAFAIWNGSAGDRNGQKSVTIWHDLKLDE